MTEWIKAARLRTFPLSLSGIILGSFIAKWKLEKDYFIWDWSIFLLAILTATLYQILSNFANDYGDWTKGTDNQNRVGPTRSVQSGKISASKMKFAIILFSILSLLSTILLLYKAFLPGFKTEFYIFIGLGIACILAAIGYTIGKKAYGYLGLGDIFVFIFFGLVAVGGSYFLFTKSFDWKILIPAAAVGMFSTAVLNMNNMRDIENDAKSGKKTLAVRLGYKYAMVYEIILLQLPLILMLVFMLIHKQDQIRNYYAFLFMILFIPLTSLRRKILATKDPKLLDPFLKQIAIICLMMVILVAFGLNHK